jgi:hypothetical protein
MDADVLIAVIAEYFEGERREMFAILGCSLGLVLLAAALNAAARDGFARGFGVGALVIALALSATAATLLVRDPPHQVRLVAGLRGREARAVLSAEADRVAAVIEKYPAYRFAALGLAVVALAAAALTRRGWVNGAAAGLLLLAVAQLTIDHYSEARAARYAAGLRAALSGRP